MWFGLLWWEGNGLAGDATALAGGFEFFVAGGVDFILPAGDALLIEVLRKDGTVL